MTRERQAPETPRRIERRTFFRRAAMAGATAVGLLRAGGIARAASTNALRTKTVFRLSTRGHPYACNACKTHAAFRYYKYWKIANGDRAHANCHCNIVTQPFTEKRYNRWFAHGRTIVDVRWRPKPFQG